MTNVLHMKSQELAISVMMDTRYAWLSCPLQVTGYRTYIGAKTDPSGRRSGCFPRCGPGGCCSAHNNAEMVR